MHHNTVLGRGFGMMGRLGEISDRAWPTTHSSQDANLAAGCGYRRASAQNVDVAVESILSGFAGWEKGAERRGIVRQPGLYDRRAAADAGANEGVANTLLNMEWYGLGA